jgi:hypothetical protein
MNDHHTSTLDRHQGNITQAAGRGEVLSYEVERENVEINTENARKAKQYDNMFNEGAGGFNPYR